MPRPHRRSRGGRVTPKGTRPGEHRRERRLAGTLAEDPPVEQMLLDNAADVAAECTELDEAEAWASSAQVLFGPVGLGGTTVLPASRALAAAGACPDRGAAAVVAASISAYGPPRDRRRAARLLEKLAESGERLPRWISAIGDVTPRRAAFLTDSWGDERSVWLDFERSDGEVRGLGMSVNGSQGTYACHFMYGPSIEVIENPSARQPHTVVRPLGLADARAMAEPALERRDRTDLDYDADEGLDHELRALVGQRVALLPAGAAALGLRIRRHTRRDRDPVVAADRNDLRMAHSDPSDVIDRDRALVVGQPIRRRAAEGSHRPIHTGDHRRQPAIPARHHHPEPRPRQPRTEQIRSSSGDDRARAPVPLRPHPRLGDPRPIHPPPTTAMVGLHLRHRPAHRAVRTLEPQRLQLVKGPVGADLGVRPLDPLLDLRQRTDR